MIVVVMLVYHLGRSQKWLIRSQIGRRFQDARKLNPKLAVVGNPETAGCPMCRVSKCLEINSVKS